MSLASEQPATLRSALRRKGAAGGVAIRDLSQKDEALRDWPFPRLHAASERLEAALRNSFGISRGSVVGLVMKNDVLFVLAFLAVTSLGAVILPLNPHYSAEEFKFYLSDAEAKFVLVSALEEVSDAAKTAVADLKLQNIAVGFDGKGEPELAGRGGSGGVAEAQTQATQPQASAAGSAAGVAASDVALILHTSGTTSKPKAVPLTHGNLTASMRNIAGTYEFGPADRGLLVMPLFHIHGLMCGLFAPLSRGGAVVLPAGGKFSASAFWKDIAGEKITWTTAVPTMLQILLARAETDFPAGPLADVRLRFIRSCSAPLKKEALEALEKTFRVPVVEAYAMTEAAHQMTSNPLRGVRKPGSVGLPQGAVEVAVLPPAGAAAAETPLAVGAVGEICVRGPNVTRGYLRNEAANRAAFTEGGGGDGGRWFRTGDLGSVDADGYVTITGRIKEMINRGGEKISPVELDNLIARCEGVAEAVAFGLPDATYGEIVAVAIVRGKSPQGEALTAEVVREFVKSAAAAFKAPAKVFFVDDFPRTPTGKVQRSVVAKQFLP